MKINGMVVMGDGGYEGIGMERMQGFHLAMTLTLSLVEGDSLL